MKNKQINPINSIDNLSDKYVNAVSTTDCTGLIPSDPASQEERDAYKEIYNFEVPIKGSGPEDSSGKK